VAKCHAAAVSSTSWGVDVGSDDVGELHRRQPIAGPVPVRVVGHVEALAARVSVGEGRQQVGEGDALSTVAVLYGIEPSDRETFASLMHENFAVIFPSEDVTTDQVIATIESLMKTDPVLARYIVS